MGPAGSVQVRRQVLVAPSNVSEKAIQKGVRHGKHLIHVMQRGEESNGVYKSILRVYVIRHLAQKGKSAVR